MKALKVWWGRSTVFEHKGLTHFTILTKDHATPASVWKKTMMCVDGSGTMFFNVAFFSIQRN